MMEQEKLTFLEEGDQVLVHNLGEDVEVKIESALQAPYNMIRFYFVEHEDNDMVQLSAEVNSYFAIVHCPLTSVSVMDIDPGYMQEVEDLLHHMLVNFSLDHSNKDMFNQLVTHIADQPHEVIIGQVFGDDLGD
jgi:hypothetical protein